MNFGMYVPLVFPILLLTCSDAKDIHFFLDYPDLDHIDPAILKYCHTAATTYIIEAGKQKADKFIISTHLEDCKFNRERIEHFCTEYQIHKDSLEIMLGSIGRCPLHVIDVCWRLEYQIKINQLHKNYCPAYLMTLRVENIDSRSHEDINFSCSMEQLQVFYLTLLCTDRVAPQCTKSP
uniref:COMM domain-containing protein 3 n=1 Tax=Naja naja TaxID=35670 RepID=A0A8C6XSY3_NAJNA